MATHQFGIMNPAPLPGMRFNHYTPELFPRISVEDAVIFPLLDDFRCAKTYWNTLDRPELGLAYWGITLIPPETSERYLDIVWKKRGLEALAALFDSAAKTDSFVIHFGI